MIIDIKVKKLHKDAVIPVFAHPTDSGFDLFTCEDTVIGNRKKAVLKTGLAFELPKGWGVQIKNKSGITSKGCPGKIRTIGMLTNKDNMDFEYRYEDKRVDITVYEGTVDMEYRGEIGIMIKNEEIQDILIPKHTKIAQGVIREVHSANFIEVDEISEDTARGAGGYGSTGTTIK